MVRPACRAPARAGRIFAAVIGLATAGCPGGTTPPGTEIGPAGGVVTAPSGATLTVPPGALQAPARLTLKVHAGPADLPAPIGPLGGWAAAVTLEPAGLAFATAVEVRLPLTGPVWPSGSGLLPVLLLGPEGWERHLPDASVAGGAATFQTTHFSTYALAADFEQATGWAAPLAEASFADPAGLEGQVDAYLAWLRDVAHLGLGARMPLSFPGQGYECQEVVGLDVLAEAVWEGGQVNVHRALGIETPTAVRWSLQDDRSSATVTRALEVFLAVFFDCASPALELGIGPARVAPDEPAALAATLGCGALPMAGSALDLAVRSGPGAVSPASATTDEAGKAGATYRASTEGTATVEVAHRACRAFSPRFVTAEGIVVVSRAPRAWTATIAARALVPEDYDENLTWDASVTGSLAFTSDDPACAALVQQRLGLNGTYDLCGEGTLATSATMQGYGGADMWCEADWIAVEPVPVLFYGTSTQSRLVGDFVLERRTLCRYAVRCCDVGYCRDADGARACLQQGGACQGADCCRVRGPDDSHNEPTCGVGAAISGIYNPEDGAWPFLFMPLGDGAAAGGAMWSELGFLPGSTWSVVIHQGP